MTKRKTKRRPNFHPSHHRLVVLRNREDLTAWLDDIEEERKSEVERRQKERRTIRPSLYNRRRITRPGTDIKKELEELALEMKRGGWQEEPSPLKLDSEKKPEHGRIMKRIIPTVDDPTTPTIDLSPSPTFTPRYGLLFDSTDSNHIGRFYLQTQIFLDSPVI
uniref:Uncharacterized protein n=1 Tax=Tetranychus urticae TaxID=32264 RepID=T1KIE8_TETUR